MKKAILFLCVLLFVPSLSSGQSRSAGQGYAFGAIGATAPDPYGPLYHFGVGGEGFVYKNVGAGGEIGFLTSEFRDVLGVFSANGSYHFQPHKKWDPFVTAGYTLLFREETANFFNLGGGTNYWIRDNLGLRMEFRDHINREYGTYHLLQLRLGLSFR
ncbi:MAG TPA: hypothetical protein VGK99_16195 [Acidobacteriota bacterium]